MLLLLLLQPGPLARAAAPTPPACLPASAAAAAHELIIASIYWTNELRIHGLADGALVTTAFADHPTFIASDPVTSVLYVSTSCNVSAFHCNGSALVSEGVVEAAGDKGYARPLAVISPTAGQHTSSSYLIVGTCNASTLLVLSLPDRRLVHTHTLEGMKVKGLAADPSGTALAVCDRESKAVHVLPWPLPGMPPLH
jgi:hypothetical protein